ncbi:MAG: DUF58 domain-containing protein [Verrucomicrobiales bacterium]|jgi:uncharacterized protein (DUF58 family)|nr:DUF58 domain-containing protein [Verrucomicrobiales bacterium]MBP9223984.1 DUF58 domain-containing protein [Verrucomicrobiales bacterium]HQZ29364.1 DUF58 domain-containing protein [Verrucomicrobiales bacterium]
MAHSEPPASREELFDADFLDRLRALYLRLRKRKQLRRKGLQSTPATGFTREFKDFRHYTPKDDYRSIDWRLYARLDRLFIRLYEEIQEFHVHIVIDTSASMVEPFPEKRLTSLKLAVALGYMGLVGHHRVSLYSIGDHLSDPPPPMKGQGSLQRILDFAADLKFGGLTDLNRCFEDFQPGRQRYGIIFVLSDLFGRDVDEAREAIRHASAWPGEIHFIQVFHPWEEKPEVEGEIELLDVETREERRLWFTPRDRERYEARFQEFLTDIESSCQSRQIDYQRWRTDTPFDELFLDLLSRGSALAGSS